MIWWHEQRNCLFQEEEAYVCIYSERNGDVILFHHQGGVDIGDVDEKALRLSVEIDNKPSVEEISNALLINVGDAAKKEYVATNRISFVRSGRP